MIGLEYSNLEHIGISSYKQRAPSLPSLIYNNFSCNNSLFICDLWVCDVDMYSFEPFLL